MKALFYSIGTIAILLTIIYFGLGLFGLQINRYFFLEEDACKKDYGILADICINNKEKPIVPISVWQQFNTAINNQQPSGEQRTQTYEQSRKAQDERLNQYFACREDAQKDFLNERDAFTKKILPNGGGIIITDYPEGKVIFDKWNNACGGSFPPYF